MDIASSLLRSLLVTYTFEDYDEAGLRAIVPRAVPLDPPFCPTTMSYKVEVPADVEELEFEAPHSPQNQVEIIGHTGLRHGKNTVKLILTNGTTGQRVSYQVTVEKKRKRRNRLLKITAIGTIASVAVLGTVLLTRHLTHRTHKPPPETVKKPVIEKEIKGWWHKKLVHVLDLTSPFL